MIDRTSKRVLGRAIQHAMEARSSILSATLSVDSLEDGRMTFCVRRDEGSRPGDGAPIVGEFLEMADAADIEVFIDIRAGEPRLIRYYRDFGFRLVDGDLEREEAELRAVESERNAWTRRGRDLHDLGVVTMFRDRWATALLSEDEASAVDTGTTACRTPLEETARRRDIVLIALLVRGMTARQAGSRVSPNLHAHEVCMRMSVRRRQGWNVPSFARPTSKAA